MENLEKQIKDLARASQQASYALAQTTGEERNAALAAMAQGLRDNTPEILAANKKDMDAAAAQGVKESLLDRLKLTEDRVEDMASALEALMLLPDPLGVVLEERTLPNDIDLSRVSVPLGVVAVVYEARPNVTADAAGICLKSGNACILRGGSLAFHSNEILTEVLADSAESAGMPKGCIASIQSTDRKATDILMSLHGLVDVLVPRGGAGLIQHCVENSKVPVIETGTGNCHVYVNSTADFDKALPIVINAKCRRFGVCNAAESLLVDRDVADDFLKLILPEFAERKLVIHGDETVQRIADELDIEVSPATDDDWEREYLGPEIAIGVVRDVNDAINHINRYGTKHSESIVAEDESAIEAFLARVDAAAVYANISTAFTDGGQFGLGAEIGISTQKLHARGPFALEALTTYKYLLRGNGQVRQP